MRSFNRDFVYFTPMMCLRLLGSCIFSVDSMWEEVQGPFKDFLDSDGNKAENYLMNGVHWYQLKTQLHGAEHYVPLSIVSERKYNVERGKYTFLWILTLPVNDIKTRHNKKRMTDDKLTRMYGSPLDVRIAAGRSCMTIVKEGKEYLVIIDEVNANKYYSGSEIMAIFMTIAVKRNIGFAHIQLTDTATKYCPKPTWIAIQSFPFSKHIPQSIFMAFLGRLDFYREWGFYAVKQKKYDAASRKLQSLTIREVITAAIDDGVMDLNDVKDLVYTLASIQHTADNVLMSAYLKPYSDDWENQCDKYLKAIAGLERIPSIRNNYLNDMKMRSTLLTWQPSDLPALEERLKSVTQHRPLGYVTLS